MAINKKVRRQKVGAANRVRMVDVLLDTTNMLDNIERMEHSIERLTKLRARSREKVSALTDVLRERLALPSNGQQVIVTPGAAFLLTLNGGNAETLKVLAATHIKSSDMITAPRFPTTADDEDEESKYDEECRS